MNTRIVIAATALALSACGTDEGPSNNDDDSDASTCRGVRCADDTGTSSNVNTGDDMGNGSNDVAVADFNNGLTPDIGDDVGDAGTTTPDMPTVCDRMPAPANRDRKVVVAHPFTDTDYEVFDLDQQGNLTQPGVVFQMGAAHEGTIQFTPDGEVGYAVQEDGTLGIFRFNDAGQPEVLDAAYDPGFYVSGALIDDAGDYLYAWEVGFRKTDDGQYGGAMYRLPLDCNSGMPDEADEFFRGKLIRAAAWLDAQRMGIGAVDLLDDETPNDAHLVNIGGPTRIASELAFNYEDAITAGFDITADGNFMLIGDNSLFADSPNTVVSIEIGDNTLTRRQSFEITDPVEIVTSPFDNAAIVLATTDDSIQVLSYDPAADPSQAFVEEGPLAVTEPTLLPLGVDMVDRGDLTGLVIIGENVAVRRVQFAPDGSVTDLGLLDLGNGNAAITGAVGVQP